MNIHDRIMQELDAVAGPGHAPATDWQINQIKHAIGYDLPQSYREFLRSYGGFIVMNGVRIPGQTQNGEDVAYVGTFYSLIPTAGYNLLARYRSDRGSLPPEVITIASGDNGYICLSVATGNRGSVYFWNSREGDVSQNYEHLYYLAPSFEEFLDLVGR